MFRGWLARFGLAELAGTAGAFAGFGAGVAAGGLLLAAALATACEAAGFYAVVLAKTAAASWRATGHQAGPARMAAAAWHAVTRHLASCAVAEAADDFLVRPWCMAAGAWLARDLAPAHAAVAVWAGFAAGKLAADAAWYGTEAAARHGITLTRRPRGTVTVESHWPYWDGLPVPAGPPELIGWAPVTGLVWEDKDLLPVAHRASRWT